MLAWWSSWILTHQEIISIINHCGDWWWKKWLSQVWWIFGLRVLVHLHEEVLKVTKQIFLLLANANLVTTVAQWCLTTWVFETKCVILFIIILEEEHIWQAWHRLLLVMLNHFLLRNRWNYEIFETWIVWDRCIWLIICLSLLISMFHILSIVKVSWWDDLCQILRDLTTNWKIILNAWNIHACIVLMPLRNLSMLLSLHKLLLDVVFLLDAHLWHRFHHEALEWWQSLCHWHQCVTFWNILLLLLNLLELIDFIIILLLVFVVSVKPFLNLFVFLSLVRFLD